MCGKKTKENEMRQRNQKTTESMGETADPRDMKRRPLRALCRFLSLSLPFSPSAWVCSTFCTSQSTVHTSAVPSLPLLSLLHSEVSSFLIAQHLLFPSSFLVAFGGRPSDQALINFLLNGLKGAERCCAMEWGMSVRVRARRQSVPHLINLESLFYDFVAVVMIECRCRWSR